MRSVGPGHCLAACLVILGALAAAASVLLVYRVLRQDDLARPSASIAQGGAKQEDPVPTKTPLPSEELVMPVKVWPLARRDGDDPDEGWLPTPEELREKDTGHYRRMEAEIWDPHPRYEVKGLGRTFRLDLRPANHVALPGIKVLHVWENVSRFEEPRVNSRGCMYTGEVVGDPNSQVSLSLCHGMSGHIWTSEGSFTIEPAEKWKGPRDNLLHVLKRLPTLRHTGHPEDEEGLLSRLGEQVRSPLLEPPRAVRRAKRSTDHEYTVELMVVADEKVQEFHGHDLEHYIVSLITAVDLIFKDPSIGNPMSITLVKMVILHAPKDWFSFNASYMLRHFCMYQHSLNSHDASGENHHDAAIFLTRENMCRQRSSGEVSCDSIGLAEVGQICKDQNAFSCAIVKETGLSTVFTIAHELGHILSLPHDTIACNQFKTNSDTPHLMASVLSSETHPWAWSYCSRRLLTSFLEEGHGWCLQDLPKVALGNGNHKKQLLGEKFDLDKQCELIYGKGYTFCERNEICNQLWCMGVGNETGTCSTTHAPWADGTPCAEGKWCQKRQCVFKKILKPVDGGWSKWQRYGDCSRTCGGGVRMSVRECNNPTPANGGKYCLGDRIRHHPCNSYECPPGSQDFREQQCADFNYMTFNYSGIPTNNVKWVPKYDGISPDERCKLYCRNSEDNQHFGLKEKVIDGTVCGPNTFDICVNGICVQAGCDHVLYSKKQLDYCGQCGGDNSTCKLITGYYNHPQDSYRSVVTIPEGASNLEVRQHGYLNSNKDNNFLALFDNETGQYLLNGNFQVSGKKSFLYGGTKLEYSGSEAIVERIRSSWPLTKDLNLQVCSFGAIYPPDISYEYTMPKHSLNQFEWVLTDEWTPCDKVCNGETWQVYKCMRGWQEFSPELCTDNEKNEPPVKACNTHCNLEWRAISKSECQNDCGPGYRIIKFACMVEKNGVADTTDYEDCKYLPRPQDTEPCNGPCIEPKWDFKPWSECSKSCGTGIRVREAFCRDSKKQKRSDSECLLSEKKTKEVCNTQECPTWQVGEWTQCSVTCGGGKRRRSFSCQYEGKKDDNEKCPRPLPIIRETCNDEPCAYWKEEPWSECSVSCGQGEETRHVYCSVPNACSNSSKPITTQPCYMPRCSEGHENAIPANANNKFSWRQKRSECSVTCGKGETYSSVECYDNIVGKVTDSRNCAGQYPPPHGKLEICYMPPCPHWVVGDWEPCSAICGPGTQSKRITCESHNGILMPEEACDRYLKPHREEQQCNIFCPQKSNALNEWITDPWSPCSVSCGTGRMVRKVICHGHCSGAKPQKSKSCDAGPCSEEGLWNAGPWSECSATCGEGTQERQIRCESREGEIISDSFCSSPVPSRRQQCKSSPCKPVYKWEITRWKPCSASCGKGVRKRLVECKSTVGETVNAAYCLSTRKRPNDIKPCKRAPCLYDWEEGDWSQCSSTCGSGIQTRNVRCVHNYYSGKLRKEVDERFCRAKPRPEHKKTCKGYCNNGFKWETGVWHPCNKPCSRKGKQKRNLYCYYGKKKVSLRFCPKELRPERRKKCDSVQCPSCRAWQEGFNERRDGEYQLWLKGRNVTIFCYKMQENHPKEYITLPSDNRAEIYSPNIRHAKRCVGSRRVASDYCESEWDNAPYGFTYFSKIHINISSFTVDSTDWTFATTLRGSPVGYGEAGDCHTRGLCPEGIFTINLQTTGFRVSPVTTWVGLGEQHAPPNIDFVQGGEKVIGRCGGCCGFCKPRDGLKLDLLPP